jgi:hypothetical protein
MTTVEVCFVRVPLNLPGGLESPANVVAPR